jgi:hypothetical protein
VYGRGCMDGGVWTGVYGRGCMDRGKRRPKWNHIFFFSLPFFFFSFFLCWFCCVYRGMHDNIANRSETSKWPRNRYNHIHMHWLCCDNLHFHSSLIEKVTWPNYIKDIVSRCTLDNKNETLTMNGRINRLLSHHMHMYEHIMEKVEHEMWFVCGWLGHTFTQACALFHSLSLVFVCLCFHWWLKGTGTNLLSMKS